MNQPYNAIPNGVGIYDRTSMRGREEALGTRQVPNGQMRGCTKVSRATNKLSRLDGGQLAHRIEFHGARVRLALGGAKEE